MDDKENTSHQTWVMKKRQAEITQPNKSARLLNHREDNFYN